MLTPKENGGYLLSNDLEIEYSGLLESGYASQGAVTDKVTLAVCFKPKVVDTALPLCDPTNHFLLLLTKNGADVSVWKNNILVGTYTTSATTHAGLLSEALKRYSGTDHGYYSNLYVVEDSLLPWEAFYAPSDQVPGWFVCRRFPVWEMPGPNVFTGGSSGGSTPDSVNTPSNLFDGAYQGEKGYWNFDSATSTANKAIAWYHLPGRKTVVTYMLRTRSAASGSGHPKSWTVEGSSDSLNGLDGTWTVIDSVEDEPDWTPGEKRLYRVDSPSSYVWYRLVVNANHGTELNTLAMWEGYPATKNRFGQGGGHYTFKDAGQLGKDIAGGNHWTMNGTQTDDTPSHNGGVAAWEKLPNPPLSPPEHFFQTRFAARKDVDTTIALPWNIHGEKWIMQLSTAEGEVFEWFDSERPKGHGWVMSPATDDYRGGDITVSAPNLLSIGSGATTAGRNYMVTVWRCIPGNPFDVVKVDHTTGTDTVFDHGCGQKPNVMLLHGVQGTGKGPYLYHDGLGADKYMAQWSNGPYGNHAGFWSPLDSAQASIDSIMPSGKYVVYLFAPPLSITHMITRNGVADGPVVDCGGRPAFLWMDIVNNYGQGLQMDRMRNPVNPWEGIQYLNGYAVSHTAVKFLACRSNGYKKTSTVFNEVVDSVPTVISWVVIDQFYKYSNSL